MAITVGSRGIADLPEILRHLVVELHDRGVRPFVVPAMGSHGGATAEGQRNVLAGYGITPESIGCPIRASMEVVELGKTALGFPVWFDRTAFEADRVLVLNRVKPHTRFDGPIQSGLLKMLMIGLGNHRGAETCHRAIEEHGFSAVLRSACEIILAKAPIWGGLAIVENARKQTALLEAVPAHQFFAREPALLEQAQRLMPKLPFDRADVLIIDRIGKDISGTGLDTNVVGRKRDDHKAVGDERPRIRAICIRGLSPGSHGNAIGIGMAEFCRREVIEAMDREATIVNAMTSNHISASMLPPDFATDRDMLDAALAYTRSENAEPRVLWIRDTLHLEQIECSTAYLAEALQREDLEITVPPRPLPFDEAGNLPDHDSLSPEATV
ncbi:lactate racemase domain-containing protein [Thermostilla marina]